MKIVFIGQKGIPSISGGVEKHVEELSLRLVEEGHDVSCYTRYNYSDKNLQDYKGVRLVNLPSLDFKNFDAIIHTFLSCLHVIFFERKVDVVHFHSIGPSSLLWLVKLLKPKTPVVATFHTQCYKHKKWGVFAREYLKLGEYVCNRFADEVIVISKNLQKYAQKLYHREVNYIPNGVSILPFRSENEIKKWGLQKDNYIVFISRLVRHKGAHHLIEAFKKIKTDKKLVIVGDGSYTDLYVEELREQVQDSDNIIFTGLQKDEVLQELFSNAYLFVQPSESEGLSIALLEAMSYKQAVLVSDIVENKEAVQNTGFYFTNKNVTSLQNELERLLNNHALVLSKKAQGLSRVKVNYNWDVITKNTIELYKRAVYNKKFILNKRYSTISS